MSYGSVSKLPPPCPRSPQEGPHKDPARPFCNRKPASAVFRRQKYCSPSPAKRHLILPKKNFATTGCFCLRTQLHSHIAYRDLLKKSLPYLNSFKKRLTAPLVTKLCMNHGSSTYAAYRKRKSLPRFFILCWLETIHLKTCPDLDAEWRPFYRILTIQDQTFNVHVKQK